MAAPNCRKMEAEAGDVSAGPLSSPDTAVPVVEVVEMGDLAASNTRHSQCVGHKEGPGFGHPKLHRTARYDKGHREKIVSKYQTRKKTKGSPIVNSVQTSPAQIWVKKEDVDSSFEYSFAKQKDNSSSTCFMSSTPDLKLDPDANSETAHFEQSFSDYSLNNDYRQSSDKPVEALIAEIEDICGTTGPGSEMEMHSSTTAPNSDLDAKDPGQMYDNLSDSEMLAEDEAETTGQSHGNDTKNGSLLGSVNISQLENELQYHFMDTEILPGLKMSGQLGLSSHVGSHWSVDSEEDCLAGDSNHEDMDVLSLYDYDTFLENEEEHDERGPSTATSSRGSGANTTWAKTQGGSSKTKLGSKESLSISISGQSERRVSRSGQQSDDSKQNTPENKHEEGQAKKTGKNVSTTDNREKNNTEAGNRNKESGSRMKAMSAAGSSQANEDAVFRKPAIPVVRRGLLGRAPPEKSTTRAAGPVRVTKPNASPGSTSPTPSLMQQNRSQPSPRTFHGHHKNQPVFPKEKVLEDELKGRLIQCIEAKNIMDATEVVGKIHQQELKIDRGVVLSLLHLLIREGAVPQLMKIFTFVCNQGVFNAEVCNAYIRLGCSESKLYDRQLKNIFQYIRRHSIQPAGDCVIALLRIYSTHKGDPKLFWLMLSYFETFPGFVTPLPLLVRAISAVLQHKDRDTLEKLNQWVLSDRAKKFLPNLDLPIVGKLAVTLTAAARDHLQTVTDSPEEASGGREKNLTPLESLPTEEEMDLALPIDFSDDDYQDRCQQIQDCITQRDFVGLAKVFVELSKNPGCNGTLVDDYVNMLLQQEVVASVGSFLHRLQGICKYDLVTLHKQDTLALAHVAACLLEHMHRHGQAGVMLDVFEVIGQCTLLPVHILLNCRGVWFKLIDACMKASRLSVAVGILKGVRLSKCEEQVTTLIKELMRQLVAAGDIPAAFSVLHTASAREAIDVSSLSPQLMWHALNVGNIPVALDLLDLQQSLPCPGPSPLPSALLRALLVACSQACFSDRTATLFRMLKQRQVYNAQALRFPLCIFQLSTLLSPAEVCLCVEDRLEEMHRMLNTLGASDMSMKKDVAIQFIAEHDPQLLAMPFLALAPRSVRQAVDMVKHELAKFSPPLDAEYHEHNNLLFVTPALLESYLRNHKFSGVERSSTRTSPSSLPRVGLTSQQAAPPLVGRQGRQWSVPGGPQPALQKPAREMKRRLSAPPEQQMTHPTSSGLSRKPLVLPPPRFSSQTRAVEGLPKSSAELAATAHHLRAQSYDRDTIFDASVAKKAKLVPSEQLVTSGAQQQQNRELSNRPYHNQQGTVQYSSRETSQQHGHFQQLATEQHTLPRDLRPATQVSFAGPSSQAAGIEYSTKSNTGNGKYSQQSSRGSGKYSPQSRRGAGKYLQQSGNAEWKFSRQSDDREYSVHSNRDDGRHPVLSDGGEESYSQHSGRGVTKYHFRRDQGPQLDRGRGPSARGAGSARQREAWSDHTSLLPNKRAGLLPIPTTPPMEHIVQSHSAHGPEHGTVDQPRDPSFHQRRPPPADVPMLSSHHQPTERQAARGNQHRGLQRQPGQSEALAPAYEQMWTQRPEQGNPTARLEEYPEPRQAHFLPDYSRSSSQQQGRSQQKRRGFDQGRMPGHRYSQSSDKQYRNNQSRRW